MSNILVNNRIQSFEPKVEHPNYTIKDHNMYMRLLDNYKHEFHKAYSQQTKYDKTLEDFDIIKALGFGGFATVFLVRDKKTLTHHAMKAILKHNVIEKKFIKQLYSEKLIINALNYPFVVSLDYFCKDNSYIYFIMPVYAGGELYNFMKKCHVLNDKTAKFYAAQVTLALEYLHHCNVIHRDIKPENIMICQNGYVKLMDFGFSKVVKGRTWSLLGTPEYLAPEIILSKGYSFSVDWWSLGILIYEMIAGYPPFCASSKMQLYETILEGQFKIPDVMTQYCRLLVKHLVKVEPTQRCGNLKNGVFDIKSHEWFHEINWMDIFEQNVIPPFIPEDKNLGDTEYFPLSDEARLNVTSQCEYSDEFQDF